MQREAKISDGAFAADQTVGHRHAEGPISDVGALSADWAEAVNYGSRPAWGRDSPGRPLGALCAWQHASQQYVAHP